MPKDNPEAYKKKTKNKTKGTQKPKARKLKDIFNKDFSVKK